MSATIVQEQRQVTLPQEVFQAAGLQVDDQVDWRFEAGETRGKKLVRPAPRPVLAQLVRQGKHLLFEAQGVRIDPEAIARAIRAERESR